MGTSILKSWQFYGCAVIRILIEPRRFFSELSEKSGIKALLFCIGCSGIYVSASLLSGNYPHALSTVGILFVNCLGMVCISAGLSHMIMVMTLGKQVGIEDLFSVYAFASGVTLLFSWVSCFIWFTEPWKWWLIYTGFRERCRFSWGRALFILGVTLVVQFFLIYSLYLAFYK